MRKESKEMAVTAATMKKEKRNECRFMYMWV